MLLFDLNVRKNILLESIKIKHFCFVLFDGCERFL